VPGQGKDKSYGSRTGKYKGQDQRPREKATGTGAQGKRDRVNSRRGKSTGTKVKERVTATRPGPEKVPVQIQDSAGVKYRKEL